MIYCQFDYIFFKWSQKCSGMIWIRPPASSSGCIIQDYGPADPDPNEIFTDPQQWFGSISPLSRGKESHLCIYQSGYNLYGAA